MALRIPFGSALRTTWNSLRGLPGGKALFSRVFSTMVPYSGTVHPLILELGPGHARIEMRDRRSVRNHLESVHAIALMNIAEMSTGLAMMFALPQDARAIITHLSIDYLKKARGTLVAECRCDVPTSNERKEFDMQSEVRDAGGELVARAQARWLVGPVA
jgi:acyl-coenzyme A thioesterase PaaI-like protein